MMQVGPWNFYESGWCDYPPAYMYVLALIDGLRTLVGAQDNAALSQVLVKLPAMLCDLVSAMLIYKWLKRENVRGGMALWLVAFYVFNPATVFDSAAWGQIDSVFTLMVVAAVYLCVQGNWKWALPVYVLSALVKPQTLMLAPIAAIVLVTEIVRAGINRDRVLKQIGIGIAISLGAAAVIIVPFWGGQSWNWLIEKYTETLSSYNYATINAMNAYAMLGMNWTDAGTAIAGIPATVWGYIFMAIAIAYSGFMYFKANDRRVMPLTCAVLIMILFTFSTKMHERYAFPAIMLLVVGYALLKDKRLLYSAMLLSVSQFVNMALVLQNHDLLSSQQAINVIFSLINIIATIYTCVCAWDICVGGNATVFSGKAHEAVKPKIVDTRTDMIKRLTGKSDYKIGMKLADWIILGAITVSYAVAAFTGLGTMSAPQTEWRSSMPGESVTIDLGEERTFDFTYYGGICDSTFTVEFSSDGVNWTAPGTADYRQGKIFQWLWYRECMKADDGTYVALVSGYPKNTARYIRLTFESVGFKMREVGFLDENGECYPIAGISSEGGDSYTMDAPGKMIDEQDTVPAQPSYYNSMYFDEIYHARTAYEHLHGLHTYEWTHPPLGKVLMSIGIAIFGMSPFGWRFMGTLVGVLMVPLMYLLTKQLFKRRDLAVFTTVLMTFDFMHFTQTRLATIDSYGVFFIMVMYLFMFRYMQMSFFRDGLKKTLVPLGLSGLFMGIGCASKWIDIYAAVGLAILFFATMFMRFNEYKFAKARLAREKHMTDELKPYTFARDHFVKYLVITLALCCVFFIAIPLVIYYFSYYWQLTPDGNFSIQGVINVQQSMLNYHSGLTNDDHPFRAAWYTWPLILKPMYYYSGREFMPAGTLSIIWCLGNPAVWWPMLAGMLFTIAMCIKEKLRDRKKLIIIVSFLAQYLPWVLVPRSMYIYHYFASIPFMIMSLCFVIKYFEKSHPRATKGVAIGLMVLAVGMFALFYPVISGAPCSQELVNFLNSLGPWNLY
ncbi:MAG: phospholipid carrier-dependent glycosyltransferase [Christensenellales bacterium]